MTNLTVCGRAARNRKTAFTLVELLTVIAIIGLLIGLLIPGLSRARDSAKTVKSKAIMKSIGDDLENFRSDNEAELGGLNYPPSRASDDPTDAANNNTAQTADIFGAQWLVRYLMGKDFKGYVARKDVPSAFFNPAPAAGWEQKGWYDNPGDADFPTSVTEPIARCGPYLDPSGVKVKAPKELPGSPVGLDDATAKYNNAVILDGFEMPICYYAANSRHAAQPNANITTFHGQRPTDATPPADYPGIYTMLDNALFSGLCTATGCEIVEWDFGNGANHFTYGAFSTTAMTPTKWRTEIALPDNAKSFAYFLMNKDVYNATNTGDGTKRSIVPIRKDSFLLLSPGKDGLFGTADDIHN